MVRNIENGLALIEKMVTQQKYDRVPWNMGRNVQSGFNFPEFEGIKMKPD